jgi:FG-GAP repeat
LFIPRTGQTVIGYLSGPTPTVIGVALGPTLPSGWALVATNDFNGDGKPDYVLYRASTGQTAILYLNNNIAIDAKFGPTLPAGWTLAAP